MDRLVIAHHGAFRRELSNIQSRLDNACKQQGIPACITYIAAADSSNSLVRGLAEKGAPHGTTVVVGAQHAGKGRKGRAWSLVPDDGLAMSILLRPDCEGAAYPMLALGAAVAVTKALGNNFSIKWPNDILAPDGRKVSGILSEADMAEGFIILGIGVNCNHTPSHVPTACAVSDVTMGAVCRETLAAEILHHVLKIVAWPQVSVLEAWRKADALLGQNVKIGEVYGIAAGIDERGALRVEGTDGLMTYVLAGDVELIGQFGRNS